MKTNFKISIDNQLKAFLKGSALIGFFIVGILMGSCNKDEVARVDPSNNLAIDSLRATKTTVRIWEKTYITAYTRGKNLKFHWKANHGSMEGKDSITVTYWSCPTCVGLNTVECTLTNEFGSVSDTIKIQVYQ